MSDLPPPPKSAARTWLRILAWIIPGVSAPAILLGWFALTYPSSGPNDGLVAVGSVGLFAVIVLACGFFNAILRRPDPSALPPSQAKSVALSMLIFVLLQVLLVPAIGYTVAAGCVFVTGNM